MQSAVLVRQKGPTGHDRAEVIATSRGLVAVLADGAGGVEGAAEAADCVVNAVRQAVRDGMNVRSARSWCRLLRTVDRKLAGDPQAGQTTAVVVACWESTRWGWPGGVAGASAGDSVAWLVGDNGYRSLSAGQCPRRLGRGDADPAGFRAWSFRGTLLVASDGLVRFASPETICQHVRGPSLEATRHVLTELVAQPGGRLLDDLSIILCRGD